MNFLKKIFGSEPYSVKLNAAELCKLKDILRYNTNRRIVQRAECILNRHREYKIDALAIHYNTSEMVIKDWIDNYNNFGIEGLTPSAR